MKGPAFQIERADTAAVFSDARRRRLILEFAKGPRALAEVAAATGMSLNLLSYHVRRLQDLGLLRLVRADPRNGRAIKFYEAVASAFVVPAHLAAELPAQELTKTLRAALDRAEAESGGGSMMYYVDGDRGPRMQRLAGAGSRAAEFWRRLNLTDAEARQLAKDLEALLAQYGGAKRRATKSYLAFAALAPVEA